jgi:colanic acid/amylovoran biosynthesis glycosyltransferase
VTVVPVRAGGEIVHSEAADLRVRAAGLLSPSVLAGGLAEAVSRPRLAARALGGLGGSRSPGVFLKNLSVVPKALWLARQARTLDAAHIHAHWAGTSATMALIAGRVSGIPWSLTAHRWDIAENNLLGSKAREARFVRAISEHGRDELAGLAARPDWSPWLLHMGVELPEISRSDDSGPPLRVLTAARLVEKKGHVHLIEAMRLLEERGVDVRVDLAGGGPLADVLASRAAEAGVQERVEFLGTVSHDDLLAGLASGRWDAAVLPSVMTASGQLEGIPVSLVEAMAAGLPVVGTETGGIPELLRDGAGILVPPKNPEALADALQRLAEDASIRARLGAAGRRRIEDEFAVDAVAGELDARFRGSQVADGSSSA